ncbi:magnesium and cobalt transport protein CorA [Adhaeribacter arboris]|uniref:Magnesium transport protein CorA n=1 Tax=Adhaeribacter arboris TaxID=2072846 RepID=A0A2T2YIQ6_9BACT|nr:magnesium/cobalt transporter CorA [Adhaeribacter arboris]PSR55375.1 magnesium and cobalt transport protein CorA [Adhaeribacter arboris]
MSAVINCAAYSVGHRIANVKISDIGKILRQTDKFVWIGLHEPDEDLMAQAQKEFGLHPLAVEDAHQAHQRPKIETFGDTLFIVLRTAQVSGEPCRIVFGETHFFVGANFILTIRHGSTLSYGEVRSRCESTPNLLRKGPCFALYAVMDSIVDQYFPVVTQLGEELEMLEASVFSGKSSRETITQIYQLKRDLLEVKHAISPLIDICNRLMRFDSTLIREETRPYFRDIYDHAIRINEMVDNTRELLTSVLEVNFSLISLSQNEVSKKFAGWAAILGIPTMVAGIYGMNFEFIPELSWHYGYPVVLGLTISSCVFLYWYFKRSGWF